MSLRNAVRKAYKSTEVAALNELVEQRRRWQRRQTIASNKLGEVEAKILSLAVKLAEEKVGIKHEPNTPKTN